MRPKSPRLAVRAVIVHEGRVLLVNAWPGARSNLLCAPGGGVEPGASLPDNLAREVYEETGLQVVVGAPCLVNEFHDPTSGFHQVEVFFKCTVTGKTTISGKWKDPENIVNRHVWATPEELRRLKVKPDALSAVAFGPARPALYDQLERIVM